MNDRLTMQSSTSVEVLHKFSMQNVNPVTVRKTTQSTHFPNTFTCMFLKACVYIWPEGWNERVMFARGGERSRFEYCGTHPLPCYDHNTPAVIVTAEETGINDRLLNITQTSQNLQHPSEESLRTSKTRGHVSVSIRGEDRGGRQTRTWPSFILSFLLHSPQKR